MTGTPNLNLEHMVDAQNDHHVTSNTAMDRFDDATQGLLAVDLDTASGSPPALTLPTTDYRGYFVFKLTKVTQANDVAVTVPDGKRFFLVDNTTDLVATFDTATGSTETIAVGPGMRSLIRSEGTDLELVAQNIYDLGFFFSGLPVDAALLAAFICVRKIRLLADLPGLQTKAQVAATADAVFTIKKNGVPKGTLQFSAASTTADTVVFSADVDFAIGDLLEIHAPTPQDATLQDISIALAAIQIQ